MQFLLAVSESFGDDYLTHIMLPVFLVAVGDNADFKFLPSTIQSRIRGIDFWNPYVMTVYIIKSLFVLLEAHYFLLLQD